ncbi:MAG: anaerobic ribonucleoside-triphosphate reductase [Methermicoccaceae archaeon]
MIPTEIIEQALAEKEEGKEFTKENCPVRNYARVHGSCMKPQSGIAVCPVCGEFYCEECGSHQVIPISRITGYLQDVSGWNAGKREELMERKRFMISK